MYDHSFKKYGKVSPCQYSHNDSNTYTGLDFIKTNELTWAPWGYAYRREFLLVNNLQFEENVQFEDVDFVMRCLVKARSIKFAPIVVVNYAVNKDSTTNFGHDTPEKISHMFRLDKRVMDVATNTDKIDAEAAKVIRRHGQFAYRVGSYRLIHLKAYRDKQNLINTYFKGHFRLADGFYLYFMSSFPRLMGRLIHIFSPILRNYMYHKISTKG